MSDAPPRTEEPRDETWPRYTREELLYGDVDRTSEAESDERSSGVREEGSDRSGRHSAPRRPPLYELLTPYGGS